jgi:predicted PurR-regulated permease PerM
MPSQPEPTPGVELLIPWRTLFKVACFLLLALAIVKLRPVAVMLLTSALIATTLYPIVRSAVRWGWPRWSGVTLCGLLILTLVGGFVALVAPQVSQQGASLIERLPTMRQDLLQHIPESYGLRKTVDQSFGASSLNDPKPLMKSFLSWGTVALEGLVQFLIILVISIYFVADGESVYAWLAAFVPKRARPKANQTAREIAEVIRRWITGQAISSTLAAIYTFTLLTILKVPGAAVLAVLAGLCDVIPVVGVFIFVIPAMVAALTVAPSTSLIVLGAYVGYHLLEAYLIVPKVFGDQLKLSMLAVLLACLAAEYLGGPLAILFALPMVACYPVIERLWLHPFLESDTVEKHEELVE